MVSYAPLTTTFTQPASCSSERTLYISNPLTLVDYLSGLDYPLVSTCYPSGAPQDQLVWSPGLVCPHQWTTVADQRVVDTIFSQTNDFCCPSGYGWNTSFGFCTTTFQTTVVFSVDGSGTTHEGLSYGPGVAWLNPIALLYDASDLVTHASSTTNAQASSALLPSASATGVSEPTSAQSTPATQSSDSAGDIHAKPGGVRVGAAVGGAVGGVVLLALIGGLLALGYRRRRQRREEAEAAAKPAADLSKEDRPELHAAEPASRLGLQGVNRTGGTELQSAEIHELSSPVAELPGWTLVQQPPAETRGQ